MTIRFGGPVFNSSDEPMDLARAHRRMGYLAGYCPAVKLEDQQRIRSIEHAFQAEDVVIAEVAAFGFNMMDRDENKRKQVLEEMCVRLTLADEVGARCCVNIAGFLGKDAANRIHPDNLSKIAFDMTVDNVRYIVDSVKPKRAKFALEMMPWIIPDGPDSFLSLLKAVDRPSFAAHLDPVNIINSPRRYFENGSLLKECFSKIGEWIVSCHAKDSILTGEFVTHINETMPGTGILDYRTYLKGLESLPQNPPLLMEHLETQEEYNMARKYIFSVGEELNIAFE